MDEAHEADNTCDVEDQSLFRARNSLETARIGEVAAVAVAANSTSQPQDGSDVAQDATVMDDEDDCQIYDVIIECSNLFQDIEATARGSIGDRTVAVADHPDLGNLTDSVHNEEPISVRDYVARLIRSLEHCLITLALWLFRKLPWTAGFEITTKLKGWSLNFST